MRDLDEADWSAFVARSAYGNVFHTPYMFEVFRRAAGHRPELWAAVGEDGIMALLAPVRLTLFGGPLAGLTTRSVAYGSLLVGDRPDAASGVDALLEAYAADAARGTLFTELRNLDDLSAHRATLERARFRYEPHLDFLLALDRTPDQILDAMGRRTRQHIRRALRQARVRVSEVEDAAGLREWYRTLELTYAHAGVPLADASLFRAAQDVLGPRGMLKLYIARVGATPAACSAELLYKGRIYAWYAGSDRAFGAHIPNELLYWEIIAWGARNGFREYDFGGAGRPDAPYGVRDFKAKFGGRLVEYGRYRLVHAPRRLALSERGYALYGRLRRVAGRDLGGRRAATAGRS